MFYNHHILWISVEKSHTIVLYNETTIQALDVFGCAKLISYFMVNQSKILTQLSSMQNKKWIQLVNDLMANIVTTVLGHKVAYDVEHTHYCAIYLSFPSFVKMDETWNHALL